MMEFFNQHYLLIRLMACFLLGFWWCTAGSLLQWSTQNPLACPVTMGLTALPIGLWMVATLLGVDVESWQNILVILTILTLIHGIFWFKEKNYRQQLNYFIHPKMILLGIALNLSLASLFSFMHFYYSARGKIFPSDLWFGFLKHMDIQRFAILVVGTIFCIYALRKIITELSKLSLGMTLARNICNLVVLEKNLLLFVSLLMCFLVFSGGVFSFWGLILPHFLRKINFFRLSLSKEIWWGGLCSGLLMMVMDYFCYQYPIAGAELPVGLLSSILGPIMLITIIFKKGLP